MTILLGILFVCLASIIYVVVFHFVLIVASFFVRDDKKLMTDTYIPSITTITCMYNEELVVQEKINNILSLQYAGNLRHIIISDGSTDDTNTVLKQISDSKIRVICMPKNVGKTMCQNIAMEVVDTDIAIFTDANTMLLQDTLVELVAPFRDDTVGCTTGSIQLVEQYGFSFERLYWKLENRIKLVQSNIYSAIGATGGLYAIRTTLYQAMPAHILSDFIVPLSFTIRGYRTVYVPTALATEALGSQHIEKKRKTRILMRALQSLSYVKVLFHPLRYPYVSFMLISHKILRWLFPLHVLCIVTLCIVLFPYISIILIFSYILLYILCNVLCSRTKIVTAWRYVHGMCISSIIGWYRFLKKDVIITWKNREL